MHQRVAQQVRPSRVCVPKARPARERFYEPRRRSLQIVNPKIRFIALGVLELNRAHSKVIVLKLQFREPLVGEVPLPLGHEHVFEA